MELPKIFDALTIPNSDTFRAASNHLQSCNDLYASSHQQLVAGHANLMTSWQGDASGQYSALHQQMQQLQEEHQQQLQQAAYVHLGVAALLDAAQIAQDIAIGLLVGAGIEFIAGFFTAGATDVLAAPEVAEAAQTEAGAQASAAAARAMLQTGFKALMGLIEAWKNHKLIFEIGGAGLGAASGLVFSVIHHDSLGQGAVNVGMDAWMGFDTGKHLSSDNPLTVLKTLGGTLFGIEQYATNPDKGNTDPFATIANWSLLSSGGDKKLPEGDGAAPALGDGSVKSGDPVIGDPTTPGGGSGGGNVPPGGKPPTTGGWEPPNDGKIHQNTNILSKLLQDAVPARQQLQEFADQFVKFLGSGTAVVPGLKDMARINEKVASYGGDASRLLDIARGTIHFNTVDEVYQARDQVTKALRDFAPDTEIVDLKDRFAKPQASGYRDIKLNIRMSNGHIVELQINATALIEAKKKETPLYNIIRTIEDGAKATGRQLTLNEKSRVDELEQQSRAIYEPILKALGLS